MNDQKLNEIETCLKRMALVGVSRNKSGEKEKQKERPAYLLNIFAIKRKLPNFVEFVDAQYLKELSKKLGGPLLFVGGTTEFEVPSFMRANYAMNAMSDEEILLRFLFPAIFKTYEIFVDSDTIEARIFYKDRIGSNYFYYEHYLRADGTEEITRAHVEDLLEQII